MRVIGEVPHSHYKISLFQWNGKFIIKIESGLMEQSYKIDEWEVQENQLPALLDKEFMTGVSARFQEMHAQFQEAISRH